MALFYPFLNFFSFCGKKINIIRLIIVDKMYFSTAVGGLKYIHIMIKSYFFHLYFIIKYRVFK